MRLFVLLSGLAILPVLAVEARGKPSVHPLAGNYKLVSSNPSFTFSITIDRDGAARATLDHVVVGNTVTTRLEGIVDETGFLNLWGRERGRLGGIMSLWIIGDASLTSAGDLRIDVLSSYLTEYSSAFVALGDGAVTDVPRVGGK